MEDFDFFACKPSHIKISNKRCKFGLVKRSGATLRRNSETKNHISHGGCHRNGTAILKHISFTDEWSAKQVQESFDIDDGGMLSNKLFSKVSSRRGKGVFSPIAGKSHWNSNVTYSMNKKKRWLLPDMLKNEVHKEIHRQNNPLLEDIDLTVIEREIGTNGNLWMSYSLAQRPDTVSVTTSIKSCNKDQIPHGHKSKRRKYGWSTDMMGLSQKRDSDTNEIQSSSEENLKPQVTYEVCRPRSPGRYPNFVAQPTYRYEENRKSRTNAKREFLSMYQDWEDNRRCLNAKATLQEAENDVVMTSRGFTETSFSVGSWLANATEKTDFPHRKKRHRRRDCSKAANKARSSMKGRVVFELTNQKVPGLQNDVNANSVADTYSERIRKGEEKRSMEVNMSLKSLKELENLFKEPLEKDTKSRKFHKVDVIRAKSIPLKYAFQMAKKVSTKSGNDEGKPAACCFTLEVINGRCLNEQNCYNKSNLCSCYDNVQTRLKTIVLSDDNRHQMVADDWSQIMKERLKQDRTCIGRYSLENIVKIADKSLKTAVGKCASVEEQAPEPKVTVPKFSSYVRDVNDTAALLLGFSTNQIAEKELADQLNGDQPGHDVELTHSDVTTASPPEYCEICYGVLSGETEGDHQASAMASCNHWFCTDCWRHHLSSVTCNAIVSSAQCPGFRCSVEVDDVTMMTLLPGHVIVAYRKRQVSNAVKRSEKYHQCSACGDSVQLNIRGNVKVAKNNTPLSCACGARWCSGCKGEPHWPATCDSAALYWKELQQQSETSKDRNAITSVSGRKCPDCHEPIEKNGGCQMMTCVCGSSFCWICMQPASVCWYHCKGEDNLNLESWDITSSSSRFMRGVREAIVFSHRYRRFQEHNLRVGLCRATASKWAAHHYPDASFDEVVAKTKQFESELGQCLLFCDSLYHIMQYLVMCVAVHQPSSKYHCSKLNRFLTRLKMAVASIEHIIFHWHLRYHRKMSPLQRAQKQMDSAKCLVKFLRNFIMRCELR